MDEVEKQAGDGEVENDSKVQEELDEKPEQTEEEIKEIEVKMENVDVKVVEKDPVGRKTPHLTDQGFFDLKFYHNKLW